MPRKKQQQEPVGKVKKDESLSDEKIKRYVPPTTLTNIKLTERQRDLMRIVDNSDVLILLGPAGTSKTFMDCYIALDLLKKNKVDRVILSKPIEESGERLGFLPGTVEEKIDPYFESYKTNFLEFINAETLKRLQEKNTIEFKPLAFMRGISLKNSLMVLDECQNADLRQIILFVTRMGQGSKIILSGDIDQSDINNESVALPFFAKMVGDLPGVNVFAFRREDIMRHSILIEITDRYEKLKSEGKIPKNKR